MPGRNVVGDRISLDGYRGTIKFRGCLKSSSSVVWLGIEWDDCQRGKHSGVYEGHQLDKVQLDKTTTLLQAFRDKYLETISGSFEESSKVTGISRSVQAIGFDRLRERNADVERLTHISLANRCINQLDIADPGSGLNLSHLISLDLSWNLMSKFEDVLQMCSRLPCLKELKLEGNRVKYNHKQIVQVEDGASKSVKSLSLNLTFMSWRDISSACQFSFPSVTALQCAKNELKDVQLGHINQTITELNLHDNQISDVHGVVTNYPHLENLDLSNNAIQQINRTLQETSGSLRHINLAGNTLHELADLAHLACYRKLKSLQYTTLVDKAADDRRRSDIIKFLPQLEIVNRSVVTQQERHEAVSTASTIDSSTVNLQSKFVLLELEYDGRRQEKTFLITQTVKQLKIAFAKFAGLRPMRVRGLLYMHNAERAQLQDDFAQLSYYGIGNHGRITRTE